MFGPVQTKLDELTTKRFINCLVGSGKTTQLIWVINTILSNPIFQIINFQKVYQ